MIPAAIGEEAEVPVWLAVQPPCRSVVTTFLSPCLNKSMEFELFQDVKCFFVVNIRK